MRVGHGQPRLAAVVTLCRVQISEAHLYTPGRIRSMDRQRTVPVPQEGGVAFVRVPEHKTS